MSSLEGLSGGVSGGGDSSGSEDSATMVIGMGMGDCSRSSIS